jgi:hypothetical protein
MRRLYGAFQCCSCSTKKPRNFGGSQVGKCGTAAVHHRIFQPADETNVLEPAGQPQPTRPGAGPPRNDLIRGSLLLDRQLSLSNGLARASRRNNAVGRHHCSTAERATARLIPIRRILSQCGRRSRARRGCLRRRRRLGSGDILFGGGENRM